MRRTLGVLLAVVLGAAAAAAQSNDEIQTGTQFNFSTPGARSLALGGAFIGLADDATAAYANPAGLTQLVRSELSAEARGWSFKSLFGAAGHIPLHELTGIGVDVVDGIRDGELEDQTAGLSFLSYVYTGNRWALALYRHQLANFEASLLTQGPFAGPREASLRTNPVQSHLELDIVNYGLSGAFRLTDDLSLGLGVSFYDFALASLTRRYDVIRITGDPLVDSLTGHQFGPADFRPDNLFNTQTQEGDDGDVAMSFGLLWKVSGRVSLGAVYRQGPGFDFTAVFVLGPASGQPGVIDPSVGGNGTFHVPDVYGLGVAYRATDKILLTFDYQRVQYSDMTDELVNLLRVGRGEPENYRAEDVGELHLGFEYQALELRHPLSFRLGLWHDPDHRLRYLGERLNTQVRFRPGDDELHVAGGLGLVVNRRTQLDLAADLSDRVDTVSLSTVVRF